MNLDDDLVDCSSTLLFDGEPDRVAPEDCLRLMLLVAARQCCSPFGSGLSSAVRPQLNSDLEAVRLGLASRLTRILWQHSVDCFDLADLQLVMLSLSCSFMCITIQTCSLVSSLCCRSAYATVLLIARALEAMQDLCYIAFLPH